jgi:hypothetical protein
VANFEGMTMRHLLVVGLLAVGPSVAHAEDVPTTGVVLAPEQQADDLLMTPSVQTQGAQRLGGTEIVNPPHDSFGMMQSPDNPSRGNLREERTGTPRVSARQAGLNAQQARQLRRDTAAAGLETLTPEQIASQQANAQAAGIQAAISSAVTAQNSNQAGTQSQPTESQPALPDQTGAPVDRGTPSDQGGAPSTAPGTAPDQTTAPNRTSTPDVLPPDATTPGSQPGGTTAPASPGDASPPAGGTSSPNDGSR